VTEFALRAAAAGFGDVRGHGERRPHHLLGTGERTDSTEGLSHAHDVRGDFDGDVVHH
jgi:hypothetical protein